MWPDLDIRARFQLCTEHRDNFRVQLQEICLFNFKYLNNYDSELNFRWSSYVGDSNPRKHLKIDHTLYETQKLFRIFGHFDNI